MTLTEILPAVRELSKADKRRLADFLSRELSDEVLAEHYQPTASYWVGSPSFEAKDFAAGEVLMKLLETAGSKK